MTKEHDIAQEIAGLQVRLGLLESERTEIQKQIELLEHQVSTSIADSVDPGNKAVNGSSPASEKIALFRRLFRGRQDVFPRRWESGKSGKSGYSPVCRNEWAAGLCAKPQIKCGQCPNQAFVALGDDSVHSHLSGRARGGSSEHVIGVYPLLPDDTCWFVAVDFDKATWMSDIAAFRDTASSIGVHPAIERSRSGNGAHAWIFFEEAVTASEARHLATHLITEAMDRNPDIGFDSYDRLFPSQDSMPIGGFGNLIALPLQSRPRHLGNSVFVDDDFCPFEDQWAFLSSIEPMSKSELNRVLRDSSVSGQVAGVSLPSVKEDDEPWTALPSRRIRDLPFGGQLLEKAKVVLGNQIYIERANLPPELISRIVRLAAFQNPEFYSAQAMRLSTFGKPRIISCSELFAKHVAIPRGCLDDLLELFQSVGIEAELSDERQLGKPLGTRFLGELTYQQADAVSAFADHDTGVLAAATAFGKTVVGAKMISERDTNTLVLVHRKHLLEQWVAQLQSFLDIDPSQIGVIHGAKKRPTGIVDIAVMQSLVQKGVVSDLVGNYGHLIVDECHHISAVSFEAIAREAKARYVLGLSATLTRRDGHQPIIFMQCGPIRYSVSAKKQAALRPFEHKVIFRHTGVQSGDASNTERPKITELYSRLSQDRDRNALIVADVVSAVRVGRSPVVITERRDHLELLAGEISKLVDNVTVLRGGMGVRESRSTYESMAALPDGTEHVIVATGRYLGEGFDDPRLDTLFLTMPISWRGTLAQYSGRLHRIHHGKHDVIIYDYVDDNEPMCAKMAAKREAGYRNLGYEAVSGMELSVV